MKFKSICLLLVSFFPFANAMDNNVVFLAQNILKLNETSNDYDSKQEVSDKFSDIKEFIQTDLKNGNKNARVDVYLLLDGLIENNLSSLQSFLASNSNDVLSKEFAQSINYDYAEKLAYALKENKHLLTTEYIVDSGLHKGKCIYYVNGHKINNNHSFLAPAGLPFYVAAYCDDKTFAVSQIHSESAQPKYEVNLKDFQPMDSEIPDYLEEKKEIKENKPQVAENKVPVKENKNSIEEKKNNLDSFIVTTGLGVDRFFGPFQDQKISNFNLQSGTFLYWNASLFYDDFFVSLDLAPLHQPNTFTEITITTNGKNSSSKTTTVKKQVQDGFLFRPGLGYKKSIVQWGPSYSLSILSAVNMSLLNWSGDHSYTQNAFGFVFTPSLEIPLSQRFILNFGLPIGLSFPSSSPSFDLGALVSVGAAF